MVIKTKKDNQALTEKDVLKLEFTDYILDDRALLIINNWSKYTQTQDFITSLKKADLSFFSTNNNTIIESLESLKISVPVALNTPAIMARILALETKFYKLESLYNIPTTSKKELLSTIKEVLVAFSNLNLQINKKIEGDAIIIEKP